MAVAAIERMRCVAYLEYDGPHDDDPAIDPAEVSGLTVEDVVAPSHNHLPILGTPRGLPPGLQQALDTVKRGCWELYPNRAAAEAE